MTSIILGSAVAIFLFGLLVALPTLMSAVRSVRGDLRLVAFAWAVVFIGQGQMFAQDNVAQGLGSTRIGELYQLGWMVVGAFIIGLALLKGRIKGPKGSLALWGLAIYGFVGVASAAFSPSPALSIYKAGQILMDAALVAVVVSVLMRVERPRVMLELSYFLLLLVLTSAALGGVLWPDIAFASVEGAYAGILRSLYPQVHFNELGLLSAIMLVASVRRVFERGTGVLRLYWACAAVLAATVLFYAQARTSLASFSLAFIIMAIFIPRMRLLAFAGALAAGVMLASQWIGGGIDLSIKGTIADTYLRRGSSDAQIESLSGRIGLWQAGWEMFKDSPVFGHGMEAGVRMGGRAYGVAEGTNMHNSHMQVLVNTGIVGYLAWLVFVVAVVRAIWRAPGGMRSEEGRFKLEMLLIAFVILFRSFLGNVLVTHHFSSLVFLALFVCAVATKAGASSPMPRTVMGTASRENNLVQPQRRRNGMVR